MVRVFNVSIAGNNCISDAYPSSTTISTSSSGTNVASSKGKLRYAANFSDIVLAPNTVCALAWADRRQRLFMCKVRAEAENSVSFGKTLHPYVGIM